MKYYVDIGHDVKIFDEQRNEFAEIKQTTRITDYGRHIKSIGGIYALMTMFGNLYNERIGDIFRLVTEVPVRHLTILIVLLTILIMTDIVWFNSRIIGSQYIYANYKSNTQWIAKINQTNISIKSLNTKSNYSVLFENEQTFYIHDGRTSKPKFSSNKGGNYRISRKETINTVRGINFLKDAKLEVTLTHTASEKAIDLILFSSCLTYLHNKIRYSTIQQVLGLFGGSVGIFTLSKVIKILARSVGKKKPLLSGQETQRPLEDKQESVKIVAKQSETIVPQKIQKTPIEGETLEPPVKHRQRKPSEPMKAEDVLSKLDEIIMRHYPEVARKKQRNIKRRIKHTKEPVVSEEPTPHTHGKAQETSESPTESPTHQKQPTVAGEYIQEKKQEPESHNIHDPSLEISIPQKEKSLSEEQKNGHESKETAQETHHESGIIATPQKEQLLPEEQKNGPESQEISKHAPAIPKKEHQAQQPKPSQPEIKPLYDAATLKLRKDLQAKPESQSRTIYDYVTRRQQSTVVPKIKKGGDEDEYKKNRERLIADYNEKREQEWHEKNTAILNKVRKLSDALANGRIIPECEFTDDISDCEDEFLSCIRLLKDRNVEIPSDIQNQADNLLSRD